MQWKTNWSIWENNSPKLHSTLTGRLVLPHEVQLRNFCHLEFKLLLLMTVTASKIVNALPNTNKLYFCFGKDDEITKINPPGSWKITNNSTLCCKLTLQTNASAHVNRITWTEIYSVFTFPTTLWWWFLTETICYYHKNNIMKTWTTAHTLPESTAKAKWDIKCNYVMGSILQRH